MENLVLTILGNRNSGKSTTWNQLFGRTVRTGTEIRRLYLNETEFVDVFLVSGSAEERERYVGDIIGDLRPRIVLCSIQYVAQSSATFQFFLTHNYSIFCHWLNPGFTDSEIAPVWDSLGLISSLLSNESMIGIRNGKKNAEERVQELRDYIYGWAQSRLLIQSD